MPRAWLTPDAPPTGTKCYKVYVPDSDVMRSAFWGAFLLLCKSENWEQFGTMTPEAAAAEFESAWRSTYTTGAGMTECT